MFVDRQVCVSKMSRKIIIEAMKDRNELEINIIDNGARYGNLAVGVLREPPFVHGRTFDYSEYLSLSIALRYIEAHGGRVYFVNMGENGRAVKIWLPIEAK